MIVIVGKPRSLTSADEEWEFFLLPKERNLKYLTEVTNKISTDTVVVQCRRGHDSRMGRALHQSGVIFLLDVKVWRE